MCRLRNIVLESVTEKCDRRTTDKVIPMCRYASQATQKHSQWRPKHLSDCYASQNNDIARKFNAQRSGTGVCGGVCYDVIDIIPRKACAVSRST